MTTHAQTDPARRPIASFADALRATAPQAPHATARPAAPRPRAAAQPRGAGMAPKTQALAFILVCFAVSAALRLTETVTGATLTFTAANAQQTAAKPAPEQYAAIETAETPKAKADADHGAKDADAHGEKAADGADGHGETRHAAASHASSPAHPASALLETLRAREAELAAYAAKLQEREAKLQKVGAEIEARIAELETAKKEFSALLAKVDGAAQKDVNHLIAMYSKMKPKEAGPLFDEMAPAFAAGFLAQMKPAKASAILASMDTRRAHAVSVELASRNAGLTTD